MKYCQCCCAVTQWKENDEILMSLLERKKYKPFEVKKTDMNEQKKKDNRFMQHLGMDWFVPGM